MNKYVSFWGLSLFAVSCGSDLNSTSSTKEAWNLINNPDNFNAQYVKSLENLPTSGHISKQPWSDYYWAANWGGLGYRWNHEEYQDKGGQSYARRMKNHQYPYLSKEEILAMPKEHIAKLSPAEKFDIFVGDYHLPTLRGERYLYKPTDPSWAGICHGWAPASLHFEEPKPVSLTNKDGVEISFGASDIKALLSKFQSFNGGNMKLVGDRCGMDLRGYNGEKLPNYCRDTNAGSFHIVVANELGKGNRGFVFDIFRDDQVWNQPAYGYESKLGNIVPVSVVTEDMALGTAYEVEVSTDLTYGQEIHPMWESAIKSGHNQLKTITYKYILELNQNKEIIGGRWLDNGRGESYKHPDFLWIVDKAKMNWGNWKNLETIYQESLK